MVEVHDVGYGYTSSGEFARLSAEIEKLNAKVEVLKEQTKIFDERFSRINEEIGELRSMIIAKEREIKELENKAIRAYDIVNEMQPDKFSAQLAKINSRIDALQQKEDSIDIVQHKIMEEFKDMKNKLLAFRGVEETLALNEEVKFELENIKKIESNIEKHSDKVESIFIKIQKNFDEFDKLKTTINELEDGLHEIEKDLEKIKIDIKSHSDTREFKKFKKELGSSAATIEELDSYKKKIDNLLREMKKSDLKKEIENEEKEKEEIKEELSELTKEEEEIEKESKDIEKDLLQIRKLIKGSFADIKKKKHLEAKKKYLEINEIYNTLTPEYKKKIYPRIKELFGVIKKIKK